MNRLTALLNNEYFLLTAFAVNLGILALAFVVWVTW